MRKRVLLIGGSGYLGWGLSHSLGASGHREKIGDFPKSIKDLGARDLSSVDLVLNLAVVADIEISAGLSHQSAPWVTNVQQSSKLIDVCHAAGKPVVHFSTREVCGATFRKDEATLIEDVFRPKHVPKENLGFNPSSAFWR